MAKHPNGSMYETAKLSTNASTFFLMRITAENYLKWSGKTSPLLVRVDMLEEAVLKPVGLRQRRGGGLCCRRADGGITSKRYTFYDSPAAAGDTASALLFSAFSCRCKTCLFESINFAFNLLLVSRIKYLCLTEMPF